MIRPLLLVASIMLGAVVSPASAGDVETAKALMERVLTRSSWRDMQGDVTLTLTNQRGDSKVRRIKIWSKTNAAGESSMLMRFVEPADVRGTGFLMIEHEGAEDDRRLYLPALRRVQRISASGSGGNFMSSDFTYYDIGEPSLDDWLFSFGDDTTVDGVPVRSVVGAAKGDQVKRDIGYARVIWFVDPARLLVVGADYFDKANLPLKQMRVREVREVNGVPFATRMEMTDVNTKHRSQLHFVTIATDQGVADSTFTTRNLRRWTR
jgi:uncharacterized protein